MMRRINEYDGSNLICMKKCNFHRDKKSIQSLVFRKNGNVMEFESQMKKSNDTGRKVLVKNNTCKILNQIVIYTCVHRQSVPASYPLPYWDEKYILN